MGNLVEHEHTLGEHQHQHTLGEHQHQHTLGEHQHEHIRGEPIEPGEPREHAPLRHQPSCADDQEPEHTLGEHQHTLGEHQHELELEHILGEPIEPIEPREHAPLLAKPQHQPSCADDQEPEHTHAPDEGSTPEPPDHSHPGDTPGHHGEHSLAHLTAFFLEAALPALPPVVQRLSLSALLLPAGRRPAAPQRRAHTVRGPPLQLA